MIAFLRLYLGAHWFSDVIGGAAFGSAWVDPAHHRLSQASGRTNRGASTVVGGMPCRPSCRRGQHLPEPCDGF
ncbi:MAG: hypothetical protein KJ755_02675 [Alphaproteobacteria bacterium]|nr:hypothetical protein [Alphaproteobacteria bacterium]